MTGKLSRVGGSAPMIRKLADSAEEKIDRTKEIRPTYRNECTTRGMSLESAKAMWVQ